MGSKQNISVPFTLLSSTVHSARNANTVSSFINYSCIYLQSKRHPEKNGFDPRAEHAGFVVENPTLGQAFLRMFPVAPASVIAPTFRANISFISHPLYIVMAIQGVVK